MRQLINAFFISFLVISCQEERLEQPVQFNYIVEPIHFEMDSLVHYRQSRMTSIDSTSDVDYLLGIDSYTCSKKDSSLHISFSFGFMTGETISIEINNDKVELKHKAYGCTWHEYYNYKPVSLDLRLSAPHLDDTEGIVGYINYVGIEDVKSRKAQWEDQCEDTSWFEHYTPNSVNLEGQFKLSITDENKRSIEYDRYILSKKRNGKGQVLGARSYFQEKVIQ